MTNISTYGQTIDQISRLRTINLSLADLTRQLSSGKKATNFADLGSQSLTSQRSRALSEQIAVYKNNIQNGERRLKLTLSAIEEIQKQASNVADSLSNQLQQGNLELDTVKKISDSAQRIIFDLLRAKDGDRFLFSGADSGNPPITDNGVLDTFLSTEIENWVTGTNPAVDTDTLITNYSNTLDTVIGYSPAISAGNSKNIYIRVDTATEIDITAFANDPGFKDILTTLGVIKNLNLDKVALETGDDPLTTRTAPGATAQEQRDNFFKVFNDLTKKLTDSIDKIDVTRFKLEGARADIDSIKKRHTLEQNTLINTISDIEDADTTEVAAKINFLRVSLESSYEVTGILQSLNLSRFLR